MFEDKSPEQLMENLFREALTELLNHYIGDQSIMINTNSVARQSDVTAIVGLGDEQFSASISLTTTIEDAQSLAGPEIIDNHPRT